MQEPKHSKRNNMVPTFEERVMKSIANIKKITSGSSLDDLSTTDKTSLVSAINELNSALSSIQSIVSQLQSDVDNLSNFEITIELLQSLGLVGDQSDQIARGDHDHEVGDLSLYFANQLI